MDSVSPAAEPRRRRHRYWIPIGILAIAGSLIGYVWLGTSSEFMPAARAFITMMTAYASIPLLLIWFVFLSGYYWRTRLLVTAAIALLVGAFLSILEKIEFTGDLAPVLYFVWDPSRDDLLEADRQGSPSKSVEIPLVSGLEPGDFSEFRGRNREGRVEGPALSRDWTQPPRQLWRQRCGGGYSAFAVAGPVAVTIEQRRDREAIVCYDRKTGSELWIHDYPAHFTEAMGGDGPRATPTLRDGRVYSLGAKGDLVCLDLSTGERKWEINILDDNQAKNLFWAMSGSPLVHDDVVVVNPGGTEGKSLVAYDRVTGAKRWAAGNTKAGYSSPMLAELGGLRQILLFDGEVIAGHDAGTGARLWEYPWETNQGINVAQPLAVGTDRVFISSGYEKGCAFLDIRQTDGKWSATPIYEERLLRCRFTSPVLHQGFIYGLDEGILVCFDPNTGKRRWKNGRYGHGQVLIAGNDLLVMAETGEVVLVEATPEAFREVTRFQAIEGKTWNNHALSEGQVFVRNHLEMACYDLLPIGGSATTLGAGP